MILLKNNSFFKTQEVLHADSNNITCDNHKFAFQLLFILKPAACHLNM